MTAPIYDLNNEAIIEQNSFWELMLFYPGNVSTSSFRGQIRRDFGGEVFANFRFEVRPYDEDANKTPVRVFLSSAETTRIPIPESSQFWRYDIVMLVQGGDRRRVLQGKVYVSPGVTN
ncbi:hypothetical protein HNI00_07255 [Thermoleptolyngbya oregonensis NK1-22]|uniref:Uncharacterized protein n=1 Tax=Thermoleptolyngbya oregonensis NK1-22 TaxID=2547457 RepID=A0AA97BPG7_9CYAN|nr:hypothetical protein [Thermoleptolyngbya oregonensis]WOB42973.1 hypothetical protein HNI00_07255 [Thermoleptolyngbya oregonensis NK1-22]